MCTRSDGETSVQNVSEIKNIYKIGNTSYMHLPHLCAVFQNNWSLKHVQPKHCLNTKGSMLHSPNTKHE